LPVAVAFGLGHVQDRAYGLFAVPAVGILAAGVEGVVAKAVGVNRIRTDGLLEIPRWHKHTDFVGRDELLVVDHLLRLIQIGLGIDFQLLNVLPNLLCQKLLKLCTDAVLGSKLSGQVNRVVALIN